MRAVGAGAFLCAAGSVLVTSSSLVLVGLGIAAFGAALPILVVASITLIQRRTPAALQGRVLTGFTLSETVPQTLSIALGAVLVAVVDYRLLLVAMALGLAASGVAALLPVRGEVEEPDLADVPAEPHASEPH